MSRRSLAAVLAVAMMAGALLLLMPASSQSASKNKVVKAKANRTFDPAKVTIKKGKKVVWKPLNEGENHSVTAYEGDWNTNQALYAGTKGFSLKFTKPGVYKYQCYFHGLITDGVCEGMCGVVKVKKPD